MRAMQIVAVAGAVQVRRHRAHILRTELFIVRGAHLDPGYFGGGVGLVGLLQRLRERVFLLDRLRTIALINAA